MNVTTTVYVPAGVMFLEYLKETFSLFGLCSHQDAEKPFSLQVLNMILRRGDTTSARVTEYDRRSEQERGMEFDSNLFCYA